jgi:hypothetical protein
MLLQDIFTEQYSQTKEVYGIELNEESNKIEYHTPPEHFETLGFVLQLDDKGLIADNLLDIIINYKITNLPIMIEVPSQWLLNGKVEAKYLISLANNVDFMISLLPPGHKLVGTEIDNEQYSILIEKFMQELLTKPNFDKFICPISNFMEYLMVEKLLGENALAVKNFKPENPYIVENFSSILNHEDSNLFKAKIRNCLYDFYGGEENFNIVASAIFNGVQSKSEEIFTQHVQYHMQQQQQAVSNHTSEPI